MVLEIPKDPAVRLVLSPRMDREDQDHRRDHKNRAIQEVLAIPTVQYFL